MRIEHPEYIQKKHSKENPIQFIICIAVLFFVAFTSIITAKADTEINIIYAPGIEPTTNSISETVQPAIEVASEPTESVAESKNISDFIYSSSIPLSADVQQYIWNKCKTATSDYRNYYYFMLGAIQLESSFRSRAVHYNKNGTVDRGLCQINSCNIGKMKRLGLISSTDDLFNIYKNIDCGFAMMNKYINKFGVTESAYYAYNTGREKGGSNSNSRLVMKYMSQWRKKLA